MKIEKHSLVKLKEYQEKTLNFQNKTVNINMIDEFKYDCANPA